MAKFIFKQGQVLSFKYANGLRAGQERTAYILSTTASNITTYDFTVENSRSYRKELISDICIVKADKFPSIAFPTSLEVSTIVNAWKADGRKAFYDDDNHLFIVLPAEAKVKFSVLPDGVILSDSKTAIGISHSSKDYWVDVFGTSKKFKTLKEFQAIISSLQLD